MLLLSKRVEGGHNCPGGPCPDTTMPAYGPYPLPLPPFQQSHHLQPKAKRPKSAGPPKSKPKLTHSAYHKNCVQPWVPPSSSASTSKHRQKQHQPNPSKKRHHSAPKRNTPEQFPLCFVCDRDYGGFFESDCGWVENPDSQDYLNKKFDKNAKKLEAMDREARENTNRQREKVLRELWEMERQRHKGYSTIPHQKGGKPSSVIVEGDGQPPSPDPSWAELLEKGSKPMRGRPIQQQKQSPKKTNKKKSQEPKNLGSKDPKNDEEKAPARKQSLVEAEVHRVEDTSALKRERFKQQKSKRTQNDNRRSTSSNSSSYERDIIKEFVDQSFEKLEKDNVQKAKKQNSQERLRTEAMKQDLVECLDMIEQSISGKILDGPAPESKKGLNKNESEESTNVSLTLTESKQRSSKKKKSVSPSSSSSSSSSLSSKNNQDMFMELLIDELKRENREVKFALAARDEHLTDAAAKVREMIEQNTVLSSRLERALSKEEKTRQELMEAQKKYEDKIENLKFNISELKDKLAASSVSKVEAKEIEKTLADLRSKLEDSESANQNLQLYITNLKKSYHSVFASDSKDDKTEELDTSLSSSQQPDDHQ